MLDPKLIEEVKQQWDTVQANVFRPRTARPLDFNSLKRFIEVCFYTTLQEEEGRQVRFACTLVSEEEAHRAATVADSTNTIWPTDVHKFNSPVEFSLPNLVKLSSAADPRLGSLAVSPDDHCKQVIWGIFAFEPQANYFDQTNVGGGHRFNRPDFLTVTATGVGALLLSRYDMQIGRFSAGEFTRATPTVFAPDGILPWWNPLVESAAMPPGIMGFALEYLFGEMSARTHGATLVMLDPKAKTPEDLIDMRYSAKEQPYFAGDVQALTRTQNPLIELPLKLVSKNRLKRLAQLSSLDGAVITDATFVPRGFGSRLRAPDWEGKCIIGPSDGNASAGLPFPIERYGTRHKSALNFAGASPGSMVFVISHDGPIRAFTRLDAETVFCWPDCTSKIPVR